MAPSLLRVRVVSPRCLLLLPGGLAAGHALGYWATVNTGATPSMFTGHGYLTTLAVLAVPLSVIVLIGAFVSGVRSRRAPVGFVELAAQQSLAYVVIEVLEHQAAGIDPAQSLAEPSLAFGVVAQVLVAAAATLVVRLVRRAGTVVAGGSSRHPRQRRPRSGWRRETPEAFTFPVATSSLSRRGPPPALLTR